jgi:hypothetical protein
MRQMKVATLTTQEHNKHRMIDSASIGPLVSGQDSDVAQRIARRIETGI